MLFYDECLVYYGAFVYEFFPQKIVSPGAALGI
jgi:hypothetical protein